MPISLLSFNCYSSIHVSITNKSLLIVCFYWNLFLWPTYLMCISAMVEWHHKKYPIQWLDIELITFCDIYSSDRPQMRPSACVQVEQRKSVYSYSLKPDFEYAYHNLNFYLLIGVWEILNNDSYTSFEIKVNKNWPFLFLWSCS